MNDNRFESDGSRHIDALIRPHNLVRLPLSGDVTRKAIEELGQETDPKRGRGNAKGRTSLNWNEMAPRQKLEHLVQDVMGWKYFPSGDGYRAALWETGERSPVGYPVAHWSDYLTGDMTVFYRDNEGGHSFNPLECMDDAWQIIKHFSLLPDEPFEERWKKQWFVSALGVTCTSEFRFEIDLHCLAFLTPETICKSALQAIGVLDKQGNLITPEPS